jgi:hypothetical protein
MRMFEAKFNRVLMTARAEVLNKIALYDALGLKSTTTKALAADFLFNLSSFTAKFESSMRAVSLVTLQSAGEQLLKEVKIESCVAMMNYQ